MKSTPVPNNKPPAPSLFDSGEVGTGIHADAQHFKKRPSSLLDLLYDGFHIIFLLRNDYVPEDGRQFQAKILDFMEKFENSARKMGMGAEDIHVSKYAYCALLDETITVAKNPNLLAVQRVWQMEPLQLRIFGSQLAGQQFFDYLESLRSQGAERLAALEVYHYALLLGFQGKYRLDAPEKINYLIARLGDEIKFLKGKTHPFSPFWAIPDQVRHRLRGEIPLLLILLLLLALGIGAFGGFYYVLQQQTSKELSPYEQLIKTPEQQASVTIYLP